MTWRRRSRWLQAAGGGQRWAAGGTRRRNGGFHSEMRMLVAATRSQVQAEMIGFIVPLHHGGWAS